MWKSILTAKILRKQAKLSHIPSHKIQFLRRLTNKLNSKENFDIYNLNCQLTKFKTIAEYHASVSRAAKIKQVLWASRRFYRNEFRQGWEEEVFIIGLKV